MPESIVTASSPASSECTKIIRQSRTFTLRNAEHRDDAAIAHVIRTVMPTVGAAGAGFAIHDPEVDAMSAAYRHPRHAYAVIEEGGEVLGGGGYGPLLGGDAGTCELRKMYFLPAARGLGLGWTLLRWCLAGARADGFRQCYLETLTGMDAARALYLKAGFRFIDAPLGKTGHFGCDRYMIRDLTERVEHRHVS